VDASYLPWPVDLARSNDSAFALGFHLDRVSLALSPQLHGEEDQRT
jgi:hypothetical protein